MKELNNAGTFNIQLEKNPQNGRWTIQRIEPLTGNKSYVLVYRKNIKHWRNLEKAIEYANNYLYNAETIFIVLPNRVTYICKRE